MKLITYLHQGQPLVGALSADGAFVCQLPYADMNTLIDTATLDQVQAAAQSAPQVALADVELLAPIPQPKQDVICLGMNYLDHAIEAAKFHQQSFDRDKNIPVYFSKRVSKATSATDPIPRHAGLVQQLDYEVELAVILGKDAFGVSEAEAQDYIFGYTVCNDVSARVLQTRHKQFYFGKGLDGFTPMGPCIVTADEISFPPALAVSSKVNGELRQSSNTNQLITTIAQTIAQLSQGMTLQAGTIIITGTPAGVGMGFEPPKFLQVGDVVECTIEAIGTICNTVV